MWKKRGNETSVEEVFKRNLRISTLEEVNDWFRLSYSDGYHIDKVDEACTLITQMKNDGITIVGDYDVDGITSTSILLLALKEIGCRKVNYRIPKRFSEGYGINESIVDEISDGLLITTDNGIATVDIIKKAKNKGLKVIIIDHHLAYFDSSLGKEVIPEADVVIDPNAIQGSARFCGYCAAGLCYKVARRLLGDKNPLLPKLQNLAAIGTVADVMELREENYVFVRNALKKLVLPEFNTPGMFALFGDCGFLNMPEYPTATDIAFNLAPVINSSSRMNDDGAKDAVYLLTEDLTTMEAKTMAAKLKETNELRKEIQKEAIKEAESIIEEQKMFFDVPMVVKIDDTPEGIVGIIAGSLCEKYKRPVICLTNAENGILRGSGRSCGNYDLKSELDAVSGLLEAYGGHKGAAGLSLKADNLDEFSKIIQSNCQNFSMEDMDDIFYDLEIEEKDMGKTIDEMARFEPFGYGNPLPVVKIKNFTPVMEYGSYRSFIGKDKSTCKMKSKYGAAIGFGMAEKLAPVEPSATLELIGTLSNNYFRGNVTRQIMYNDFLVSTE